MIEVSILSAKRLQYYEHTKRNSRRFLALFFPAIATATGITKMDEFFGWREVAILGSGALALLGPAVYFLYGLYYDWCVRNGVARQVREKWGDNGTSSETEFLDDKFWTKQHNMELALPWSSLVEIEDRGDSVLLWFDQSMASFPNRAFKNAQDRATLLETARELGRRAGATVKTSTPG